MENDKMNNDSIDSNESSELVPDERCEAIDSVLPADTDDTSEIIRSEKNNKKIKKTAAAKALTIASILLLPIISLFMSECVHDVFIYDFSPQGTIANYILFSLLYAAGVVLFGSLRRSVIIMSPIIYIFSVVTQAVLDFRGTPVMPADIMSIGTGLNVASGYEFSFTGGMAAGLAVLAVMMVAAFLSPWRIITKAMPLRKRLAVRLALLFIISLAATLFYTTDIAADHSVRPDFWDQSRGYRASGTILNFVLNSKYLIIEKPDGYSSSEIPGIINSVIASEPDDTGILDSALKRQESYSKYTSEYVPDFSELTAAELLTDDTNTDKSTESDTVLSAEEIAWINRPAVTCASRTNQPSQSAKLRKNQQPDIIVIMNETWSDLHALGDFETNMDYMPFTRNLTKNTIKGNLYMPVLGAGTSNSEFEFLTGNTMAFLTGGSNAYELYIKQSLPSVVRTLTAQNYSATGMHPYFANSWKRNINYPLLGFDDFISLEDIIGEDLTASHRSNDVTFLEYRDAVEAMYPDDKVLIRRFVSDSFDYKYIENLMADGDEDRSHFIFNVTMQNHGGYESGYTNFEQKIRLTSTDNFYPKTNRFLSLMYETDRAFEELINYYDSSKKPVIILMFGDHQPSIESEFVEEVLGNSLNDLSLEEKQRRYVTPFVIWANYDIPEGYIDMMSSNYLSTLLLQTAGLKTTQYNDYLSALYRQIPVIDTTGYITADGVMHSYTEENEYSKLLSGYEKIEYNYLFDAAGKKNDIFCLKQQ